MAQAADTSIKNPVKRDGVSQRQRRLAALGPGFVKVDERTTGDFMLFALEFSRQLHYYNEDNELSGDWEAFWGSSPSVMIASIERFNPLPLKEAFSVLRDAPTATEAGVWQMFAHNLALARKLDDWLKAFSTNDPFGKYIKTLVGANLASTLPRLLAYELGAAEVLSADTGYLAGDYSGFSPAWNLGDPSSVEPDKSLFNPLRLLDEDELPEGLPSEPSLAERLAAAYDGLNGLFTEIYNILFQVIKAAPGYFSATLEQNGHQPHIALFITFLKLYELLQDDLNRMTERHLDFYYKDVLQLKVKDAVPDKVHLFFELAKQVEEHQLKKDTRFRAGKDSEGKELFYTLDQETVFNRAQVESLRSVYSFRKSGIIQSVHAAPVANSADGQGAKFPKTEDKPSWPTLGNENLAEARLGFAIASRELQMAEGARTVTLAITTGAGPSEDGFTLNKEMLEVKLSGAKEWIDVGEVSTGFTATRVDNLIKIQFTLPAGAPPVVGLDAKKLKTDYGTDLPVLRVLLKQFDAEGKSNKIYECLHIARIENISLTVHVAGASRLMAFSDDGAVDTAKPFMPFGASPKAGSAFYVGCAEAALKSLDSVTLHVTWQQLPADLKDYYAGYNELPNDLSPASFTANAHSIGAGGVNSPAATDIQLFKADNGNPDQSEAFNDFKAIIELTNGDIELEHLLLPEHAETFGQNTKEGFLRFDLNRDFEHEQYPTVLTRQMLAASKLPWSVVGAWYWEILSDGTREAYSEDIPVYGIQDEVVIPNSPYTPVIKELSLDYTSTVTYQFENDPSFRYFHIHPFTDTYEHLKPEKNEKSVLPLFPAEGALYIGLKDLEPLQSLQLLFQVAENTADAGLDPAEIKWSFLADNEWQEFDPADIPSDTTKGLINSGIITLAMPAEINKNNTLLPSDLHWLRVAAAENAKAVSEAINIYAQAALVAFQDNDNAESHLKTPLEPKKIGKPEVADSALKKINQEYQSFGGRAKEDPLSFYTRVSERLRHKGRAITLFDYERLVLEAFPDIFKVKCVNHTNAEFQLRPGHVLISVIPDFSSLKAVDRRQPKVTRARLEAIREYLEARNTAFVGKAHASLHLANPVYEVIQVAFSVQFKPEITAKAYYARQLEEAIIRYLSPWAYEDGAEINFGGKVYKASILDFVEGQDYVDFVTGFSMSHTHSIPADGGPGKNEPDISFAEARTPISILVPASEMSICIIGEDDGCTVDCPKETVSEDTLGYMAVDGRSFTVRKP
ncbi:MAG: baseplate J/gp47 family protein [Phaeodactylibacter sp.]|nr:baseplate J/gp47 family protein [Phaeodactylibacter sp.]MCB9301677.1 baseplate J/gp47 family protein [Lewinellaceae bacterium]